MADAVETLGQVSSAMREALSRQPEGSAAAAEEATRILREWARQQRR